MAEGITEEGIARLLDPIHNRAWVVDQCLTAVATDAWVQSRLLDYGLAETERQLSRGTESAPQDAPAQQPGGTGLLGEPSHLEWTCRRVQLLQHKERLGTLQHLSNGYVCTYAPTRAVAH